MSIKKKDIKAAVRVYLHPMWDKSFYMNGTLVRATRHMKENERKLSSCLIPLEMYEADQERWRDELEDFPQAYPMFVRVEEPTDVRGKDLIDQEVNDLPNNPDKTRPSTIIAAFRKLDHGIDSHWTKAGLPRMDVMERFTGFDFNRSELEDLVGNTERNEEDEEDDG